MNSDHPTGTHQKAFRINLDNTQHGTFAEIGAGQEVARWFFRVGAASGTVAKTLSAYDMRVSDAIYGPCPRYVSRQRLQAMFDHEYALLIERLDAARGADTRFFVFADTVAARSYSRRDDSHGWAGIRFQMRPRQEPSQIIIHVRLLDHENVQQQEALGILGVNLIHGALYQSGDPADLISSLLDDLSVDRIEVDMIEFSGPGYEELDNRLMALQLVAQGLSPAAMFTAAGEVVQPAEVLYKQPVVIERGSFRPVTRLHVNLLRAAAAALRERLPDPAPPPVVLMEMTLTNLLEGDQADHADFLARADALAALGQPVMISHFGHYYKLAEHLGNYTKGQPLGIALGVPALQQLFDEQYYTELSGGLLESFGRLFKEGVTLYVYPLQEAGRGSPVTAETLELPERLRPLRDYLSRNGLIRPLPAPRTASPVRGGDDLLAAIRSGDSSWEPAVPELVAARIKERGLFGYKRSQSSLVS